MGGCKCVFRSCPVNSQKFPNMSFFHFPVSKSDRLIKWIEYSNFQRIYTLTTSQAKNKAVCGLHFKEDCFMNYKRNRLTPTAIPTLYRLGSGKVLDYSLSDDPKPMDLPPTTAKHLIPPPGTLIWGHPQEFWEVCPFMGIDIPSNNVFPVIRQPLPDPQPPNAKKPRILNKDFSIPVTNDDFEIDKVSSIEVHDEDNDNDAEVDAAEDISEITLVEEHKQIATLNSSEEVLDNICDVITIDDVEFITDDPPANNSSEEAVPRTALKGIASAYEAEIEHLKKQLEAKTTEADKKIGKLKAELATAELNLKILEDEAATSTQKTADFEKALALAEAKNRELLITSSDSKVKIQTQIPTSTTPTTLTKAQLFNGIKKYLSSSMTALVRMEMFGNMERAWKPDEKQVSVELLKLGENVYKFFTDEWRLRMPPMRMVEDWSNEVVEEEEDDL